MARATVWQQIYIYIYLNKRCKDEHMSFLQMNLPETLENLRHELFDQFGNLKIANNVGNGFWVVYR